MVHNRLLLREEFESASGNVPQLWNFVKRTIPLPAGLITSSIYAAFDVLLETCASTGIFWAGRIRGPLKNENPVYGSPG